LQGTIVGVMNLQGNSLSGRVICVVGGTAGIGRAVAVAASAQGARVTIAGRTAEKTAQVAGELGVAGQPVDIMDENAVADFFESQGEMDHLVVSACSVKAGPLRGLPSADAEFTMRSKFFGPYLCAKHAQVVPGGSITFFSGILSRRPEPQYGILAAINAAVEAMGRALAIELAPIRVNTISPGLTRDTEAFGAIPPAERERMFQTVGARLPVGRVGTPEEMATAAIFLMRSPSVTGITLDIDGGALLV